MKILLILCLIGPLLVVGQDGDAFQWFDKQGKKVSFKQVSQSMTKKELVLFGEHHDNPLAHFFQLQLLLAWSEKKQSVALGLEMFERHQVRALASYCLTKNYKQLKDSTDLWLNFKTDYKPIIDSAINRNIPVFAGNITRKYASLVFKKGMSALDSLSENERKTMCPLPFPFDSTLSQYSALIQMGLSMHQSGIQFAQAQAIKDATMAFWINNMLQEHKRVLFLNGSFHSDYYQGIYWYVKYYAPNTQIGTISTVEQASVKQLDKTNRGLADYILVVNQSMIRTH